MLRRCSLNRNVGIALTAMRALRLGLMGLKVGVDVRVDAASVRSPAAYYPKDAGQDQRCDPWYVQRSMDTHRITPSHGFDIAALIKRAAYAVAASCSA